MHPALPFDLPPPGGHAVRATLRITGLERFPDQVFVLYPVPPQKGRPGRAVRVLDGQELPDWRGLSPQLYALPARTELPAEVTEEVLAGLGAVPSRPIHRQLWAGLLDPTSLVDTTIRVVAVEPDAVVLERTDARTFGSPLPFVILGGLVLLLALSVWRRRRRRVSASG
jgi:hypothetical protein